MHEFSYKKDGNLTGHGCWGYLWNVVIRSIQMENNSNAPGQPVFKSISSYNWKGRQVLHRTIRVRISKYFQEAWKNVEMRNVNPFRHKKLKLREKSLMILGWLSLSVLFFAISGHGCSNKSSSKGDDIGVSVSTENDAPSGEKIVIITAFEKFSDLSDGRRASLRFRIGKDTRIVDVSNPPSFLRMRLSDSNEVYNFDLHKLVNGEYANLHQSQVDGYSSLDDFAKGSGSE